MIERGAAAQRAARAARERHAGRARGEGDRRRRRRGRRRPRAQAARQRGIERARDRAHPRAPALSARLRSEPTPSSAPRRRRSPKKTRCCSCKFSLALRRSFVAPLGQSSSPPIFRALLRNLFGELQMRSLADYVQVALMLNYNQRNVG